LPPSDLQNPWEEEFIIKNLTDKRLVRLHYVRMNKNIGGAGGFHEGVRRSYKRGYDWIWLMDDDAEPKVDALELLIPYTRNEKISGISNLKVSLYGKPEYMHRGWKDICGINSKVIRPISDKDLTKTTVEIDHSSFVGLLISSEIIKKAGYPKAELYIHFDDVEYSFRLREYGPILLVTNSIIYHKDQANKSVKEIRFLSKPTYRIDYDSFWIKYFDLRNVIYLKRKECGEYIAFCSSINIFIRSFFGVLLFDDNKLRRIKLIMAAIIDAFCGSFDNNRPKNILYNSKAKSILRENAKTK
jgi:GT2 family glycosyltransferase